jgi:hypothetical protein
LADQTLIDEINRLVDSGLKAGQVAAQLGISPAQVYTYSVNRPSALQAANIEKCIKAGAGVQLTADFFGVTYQNITAVLKRRGFSTRKLRHKYPLDKSLTVDKLACIVD